MQRRYYDFDIDRVLDAIRDSFGIVSTIAQRLDNCAWSTARKYVQKWAITREAYQNECERGLDYSETQMLKLIQQGDGPMIRFHLATKGKDRGYVQRQEQVLQGDTLEVTTRVVRRADHASSDD